MKKAIAALALLVCAASHAEPTVLRMPELGWEVRFDAPATRKIAEESSAQAYHYAGNAERFNLSLFIEAAFPMSSRNRSRWSASRAAPRSPM